MKPLSQRDNRWASKRLGTCTTTIGKEGCAITCVAMLANTTPTVVNSKGRYVRGCLIQWNKIAKDFKLKYSSVRNKAISYPTIGEVRLSGYQHFVVVVDKLGWQLDPRTGQRVFRKYKVLSYRNLTTDKEEAMWKAKYGRLEKKYYDLEKKNKDNYNNRIIFTRKWRIAVKENEKLTKRLSEVPKVDKNKIVIEWFKKLFKRS